MSSLEERRAARRRRQNQDDENVSTENRTVRDGFDDEHSLRRRDRQNKIKSLASMTYDMNEEDDLERRRRERREARENRLNTSTPAEDTPQEETSSRSRRRRGHEDEEPAPAPEPEPVAEEPPVQEDPEELARQEEERKVAAERRKREEAEEEARQAQAERAREEKERQKAIADRKREEEERKRNEEADKQAVIDKKKADEERIRAEKEAEIKNKKQAEPETYSPTAKSFAQKLDENEDMVELSYELESSVEGEDEASFDNESSSRTGEDNESLDSKDDRLDFETELSTNKASTKAKWSMNHVGEDRSKNETHFVQTNKTNERTKVDPTVARRFRELERTKPAVKKIRDKWKQIEIETNIKDEGRVVKNDINQNHKTLIEETKDDDRKRKLQQRELQWQQRVQMGPPSKQQSKSRLSILNSSENLARVQSRRSVFEISQGTNSQEVAGQPAKSSKLVVVSSQRKLKDIQQKFESSENLSSTSGSSSKTPASRSPLSSTSSLQATPRLSSPPVAHIRDDSSITFSVKIPPKVAAKTKSLPRSSVPHEMTCPTEEISQPSNSSLEVNLSAIDARLGHSIGVQPEGSLITYELNEEPTTTNRLTRWQPDEDVQTHSEKILTCSKDITEQNGKPDASSPTLARRTSSESNQIECNLQPDQTPEMQSPCPRAEGNKAEENRRLEEQRVEREKEAQEREEAKRRAMEETDRRTKGKRKGLGGLSPEKKKLLKNHVETHEDRENNHVDDDKVRYLRRKIKPLPSDLDSLNKAELQKIVKALHQKVSNLEEEVYDWEVKIRKQDFEINELTLKVNDTKGKFVKPVLKKVSKTEAKLAKVESLVKKDFRNTLKSTGQSKFKLDEADESGKTPDWRTTLKPKEGEGEDES